MTFLISWIASALELLGLWQVGNKKKIGFLISIAGNITWIAVAVLGLPAQGLLLVVVPAIFINARNFIKWRKNMDAIKLLELLTDCREGKRDLKFYTAGEFLIIADMTDPKTPYLVYEGTPTGFIEDFMANFKVKHAPPEGHAEDNESESYGDEESTGC